MAKKKSKKQSKVSIMDEIEKDLQDIVIDQEETANDANESVSEEEASNIDDQQDPVVTEEALSLEQNNRDKVISLSAEEKSPANQYSDELEMNQEDANESMITKLEDINPNDIPIIMDQLEEVQQEDMNVNEDNNDAFIVDDDDDDDDDNNVDDKEIVKVSDKPIQAVADTAEEGSADKSHVPTISTTSSVSIPPIEPSSYSKNTSSDDQINLADDNDDYHKNSNDGNLSDPSEKSESQLLPPPPIYQYLDNDDLEIQMKEATKAYAIGLCVIDFDHIKGPIIQYWIDNDTQGEDRKLVNQSKVAKYSSVWPDLAFEALPDGAHLYDETFINFTLNFDPINKRMVDLPREVMQTDDDPLSPKGEVVQIENPYQCVETVFGCGCIRQVETSHLSSHNDENIGGSNEDEYKRGTVQKSVVLITREPLTIQLKEKLGVVTQSWFDQYNFEDLDILNSLWTNIDMNYNQNGYTLKPDAIYEEGELVDNNEGKVIREHDIYSGLNLQLLVLKLKRNLLVLFKALILGEARVLVFSKELNMLSNFQYSLIGLMPTLLLHLKDCGFPLLEKETKHLEISSGLKSSDRGSMMKFLGLPLPIFSKGGVFQPYMTLQQSDYLSNNNCESFVIGASNDIILDDKEKKFDIVVYLDENDHGLFSQGGCKFEILNKQMKDLTSLTGDDKRFIDFIVHEVTAQQQQRDTGDEEPRADATQNSSMSRNFKTVNHNPSMENGDYKGGDDFIRSQFEEYVIGFLATVKYDKFLQKQIERGQDALVLKQLGLDEFSNHVTKFGSKYSSKFMQTRIGLLWDKNTEDELFNFFEPKHAGAVLQRENVFTHLFSKGNKQHEPQSPAAKERLSPSPVPEEHPEEPKPQPNAIKEQFATIGRDVGGFFRKLGEKGKNGAESAEQAQEWDAAATSTDAIQPQTEQAESQNSADSAAPPEPAESAGSRLRGYFGW